MPRCGSGVKRRNVSKDEIIERLIYPMVNEGARILEEGIATRPGDIDVVWLYGYGFPAWRGGPMHWADTVGLKKIRDRLRELAKETGDKRHEPAALLNKLADEGGTFAELRQRRPRNKFHFRERRMTEAVIVSTARTPIGKAFRGAFNMTHGATLGGHVVKHAVERAGIDPAEVEDVVLGCATPEKATGANIARLSAIRAGMPVTVSGRDGEPLLLVGPADHRDGGAAHHRGRGRLHRGGRA